MKLVIVDDDSLLCGSLSRCLVRLNHSSRMATSVDAALALIAAEAPGAILTDLDLGIGGDGIELIRRLRETGSRTPVLMMTGSDPDQARARLSAAGLGEVAVLSKPFEFDELLGKLAEMLPLSFAAPEPARPPSRPTPVSMAALKGVFDRISGRVI
jgi:DNA-binding response OmpR family regulator